MTDHTAHEDPRRGGRYAWFVVVLLMLAFALSMVDRMILSLLVTPLKSTYGYSDVEISLLQGLAFSLFYVTCGIPIGWMADRFKRTTLISWCILVWSVMTALSAFTRGFTSLFVARVGVGVGEAGLGPAANSLIADLFPPHRLSKPIALYSAGALFGPALAMIGGGAIVDHLLTLGDLDIPLAGQWPAWQMIFMIAGLPGLLLALAFRFVREPQRHGLSENATSSPRETIAYVRAKKGFLIPHFLGASLASLSLIAFSFWIPTFIVRAHGYTPGQAAQSYGIAALFAGLTGLALAGWAADFLARRGVKGAPLVVTAVVGALSIAPLVAAMQVTDERWFFVLLTIGLLFAGPTLPMAPVAMQIFVPNERRGQVYAVYLLVTVTAGYMLGPFLVAFITQHLLGDEAKLGVALALVAGCALPLSPVLLVLALKRYRAEGHP